MVLVRKRFFRRHCEDLLAKGDLIVPRLSRESLAQQTSLPLTHVGKAGGESTARHNISGPSDARLFSRYVAERVEESAIASDDEGDDESIAHRRQCSGQLTPIEEELYSCTTTAVPTRAPSPVLPSNHPSPTSISVIAAADHGSSSCVDPHFAQRQFLRVRTRGLSMVSSVSNCGPSMRRQSTRSSCHTYATAPQFEDMRGHLYSGHGGFPGPLDAVDRVLSPMVRTSIRNRLSVPDLGHTLALHPTILSQAEDKEAQPSSSIPKDLEGVNVQAALWLPKQLGALVIGRNSRFFTEELDDETMAILGGVEYRALRLLTYLIPLVREPGVGLSVTDGSIPSCSSWSLLLWLPYTSLKFSLGILRSRSRMESKQRRSTNGGHFSFCLYRDTPVQV